ncbi:MAG TPA: hypothetical protein VHH36_02565, partial [Candidatus Thermoplasmatota archaeon]|nr:hypothetical protein [Candidatus Thermoplasmatota archaeon]
MDKDDRRTRAPRDEGDDATRTRLTQQNEKIAELEAVVKAYEEKFNQIKEPPLLSAYVLRMQGADLEETEVVVAHGTQVLKVATGNVEKNDLRQGQYVWLHPKTYAIIASSKHFEQGVVGKVVDMYTDKLVVTTGDGFERKIIDLDPALANEIKIGYEVSLLPPSLEILEVRPSSEIRDLFLGETPNVRYAQIGGLTETIERIR